jgi:hypothetical protein
MEAVLIGRFVLMNGGGQDGGVIVERHWIDERGNPTSYKITTWIGQPPIGGDRGGDLA